MVIIICGVTGVGKTTIGQLLAQELGWDFYDADDFHSVANIAKMEGGIPLTDEDRQPWLGKLRELIEQCLVAGKNAVLACSALKKAYRDSQFEDLEEPQPSEHALLLELGPGPGDLVELIKTKLKLRS